MGDRWQGDVARQVRGIAQTVVEGRNEISRGFSVCLLTRRDNAY